MGLFSSDLATKCRLSGPAPRCLTAAAAAEGLGKQEAARLCLWAPGSHLPSPGMSHRIPEDAVLLCAPFSAASALTACEIPTAGWDFKSQIGGTSPKKLRGAGAPRV